jgi:hypothetical protein
MRSGTGAMWGAQRPATRPAQLRSLQLTSGTSATGQVSAIEGHAGLDGFNSRVAH